MTLYLFISLLMLCIGIIFIAAQIKGDKGWDAVWIAIYGAVIVMSAQALYTGLTGKLPAGLVSMAKEVNENRTK